MDRYEEEVKRLRKALARADSTIVWFEKRKAVSEALFAAAKASLKDADSEWSARKLTEAVAAYEEDKWQS